jgi:hypothetical protein
MFLTVGVQYKLDSKRKKVEKRPSKGVKLSYHTKLAPKENLFS